MACASPFKSGAAVLAAAALIAASCDLPRDNPLDPKNPEGSRPRRVLVEAFVNLNTGFPYDAYVIDALDSLESLYGDRVAVAEYHRNVAGRDAPYPLSENELLYESYLAALGSTFKGVPDVFVAGAETRVQGASGKASAFLRLQQAVLSKIGDVSRFSVEVRAAVRNGRVFPEVTLARLGVSDSGPLTVKAMLVARAPGDRCGRVVFGSVKAPAVENLGAGEVAVFSLPDLAFDPARPSRIVAAVCSENGTVVFQCAETEVKP